VTCCMLCAVRVQLFWEAFPAEGGKSRTTYMFAYSGKDRPNSTHSAVCRHGQHSMPWSRMLVSQVFWLCLRLDYVPCGDAY
jgi:hypothetical protein